MPLQPLTPVPPYTILCAAEGRGPALQLAPLILAGTPKDLPLTPIFVAHVITCFESLKEQVTPHAPLTLIERGRGLLDKACTIYAAPALGAPDEDRRKAHAFVRFRGEWQSYLHDVLLRVGAETEVIVCPVEIGYRRLVAADVEPLLLNSYFVLESLVVLTPKE